MSTNKHTNHRQTNLTDQQTVEIPKEFASNNKTNNNNDDDDGMNMREFE